MCLCVILPTLSCHAKGGGTALGPPTSVPGASFKGTNSPWLLLSGADTLLALSPITPGASAGHVGPVSVSANSGQSEGQGREHSSAASHKVDIFTLLCHREYFLTPVP